MTDTGLFGSMYATPGGVDPLAIMRGIVDNQNAPPSIYATPGGVDPGAVMRGIVEQFALQQQQQPQTPPPMGGQTAPHGLYWNPLTGVDALQTMMGIVKNRQGHGAPTQPPLWARGGAQPSGGHGPLSPTQPTYFQPKQAPTGPQGPPQAPAWSSPWGSLNGGWG
jgi:hypothetical protein